MLLLRARTVFPIDAPKFENGAVVIDGPLIVGCGPFSQIRKQFDPDEIIDLGDCLLMPGLVNAHTHLELSDLVGQVEYKGDFVDWIKRLTILRGRSIKSQPDSLKSNSADPLKKTINHACRQSLQSGVTTVGDICYQHRAAAYLPEIPIRKTCFAEVFGITDDLDTPEKYLRGCIDRTKPDQLLRLGLSPHAPYSAGPGVYELTAQLARQNKLPLTTHLAETTAEREFLLDATGPWLDYLKLINKWDSSFICPRLSPVEYFLQMDLADQPFLLAHVNYISDDELATLARTKHSVAYCPRSHRFFGHPPHRFVRMLELGLNVCLGTDSLASNDTLSILDEMRFIHRHLPDVPAETLLTMGTTNGAKALRWHDKIGTISPGMEADLIALNLTGNHKDDLTDILESTESPKMTIVRGQIVHKTG